MLPNGSRIIASLICNFYLKTNNDQISQVFVAVVVKVGSIVADAASQHLEWVYDQAALTAIVGDENPEFWFENKCPFFNIPNGKSR